MSALKNAISIKRVLAVAALTVAWCGLWADLSVANLAAGFAISVVLTNSTIGTRCRGGIRLVPLAKLIALVLGDLFKSTISVALEIVTPIDSTEESIIAVKLPPENRDHLLFLVVAITLTPGTAVVDADPDTATLYLHLLHHDRMDETVAHVHELASLTCAALPTNRTGVSV